MVNLNFFFWNYILLFVYVYGEIFFKLIFLSIFKNLKLLNITSSKRFQTLFFKNKIYIVSLMFLFFFFITLKVTFINSSLLSVFFLLLIFLTISLFYPQSNFIFLLFNLFYLILFSMFIDSIVIFFLFIEVYAILFYFIFLNNIYIKTPFDTLKLKNMLLLYLISNFITTALLLIGLNAIIEIYGTSNFFELNTLVTQTNCSAQTTLIVIGFLLKLALPTLHFLKLEIYKYLHINFVLLFSIITLIFNYYLVINFLSYNIFIFTLLNYKFAYILLCLNLVFLTQKLKLSSFNEFVAYSGFTTNNLILINFLLPTENFKFKLCIPLFYR